MGLFGIRSSRVALPVHTGSDVFTLCSATVIIDEQTGHIVAILKKGEVLPSELDRVEDIGKLALLPGRIDINVNLSVPGRDGPGIFEESTRAAAAGGITTLMDQPAFSNPPTVTMAAFREKRAAATGNIWVNCGFFAGVAGACNVDEISAMLDAGAWGVVAHMVDCGEPKFPSTQVVGMRAVVNLLSARASQRSALRRMAQIPLLLVHAELYDESQLELASPLRFSAPRERMFAATPEVKQRPRPISPSSSVNCGGAGSDNELDSDDDHGWSSLPASPTIPQRRLVRTLSSSSLSSLLKNAGRHSPMVQRLGTSEKFVSPEWGKEPLSDLEQLKKNFVGAVLKAELNSFDKYRVFQAAPVECPHSQSGNRPSLRINTTTPSTRKYGSLISPMQQQRSLQLQTLQGDSEITNPAPVDDVLNLAMPTCQNISALGTSPLGRVRTAAQSKYTSMKFAALEEEHSPRSPGSESLMFGSGSFRSISDGNRIPLAVPLTFQDYNAVQNNFPKCDKTKQSEDGVVEADNDTAQNSNAGLSLLERRRARMLECAAKKDKPSSTKNKNPKSLVMSSRNVSEVRKQDLKSKQKSVPEVLIDGGRQDSPRLSPTGDESTASTSKSRRSGATQSRIRSMAEFRPKPIGIFKIYDPLSKAAMARNYGLFLSQRPAIHEERAIAKLAAVIHNELPVDDNESKGNARTGENLAPIQLKLHLLNMSSATCLPLLEQAVKALDGQLSVSVSLAPHHLALDADMIMPGTVKLKCNPPIREPENRSLLWRALASTNNTVSSNRCGDSQKINEFGINSSIRTVGTVGRTVTAAQSAGPSYRRLGHIELATVERRMKETRNDHTQTTDGMATHETKTSPAPTRSPEPLSPRTFLQSSLPLPWLMCSTGHLACLPELKSDDGDFNRAIGGVASLQLGISVLWTEAERRGVRLEEFAAWGSSRPARILGLEGSKGRIEVGLDADLIVFNPESTFEPISSKLTSEHEVKLSPYLFSDTRRLLRGVVVGTYIRGQRIYHQGEFLTLDSKNESGLSEAKLSRALPGQVLLKTSHGR